MSLIRNRTGRQYLSESAQKYFASSVPCPTDGITQPLTAVWRDLCVYSLTELEYSRLYASLHRDLTSEGETKLWRYIW